jgi:Bifunctional DNA primase/polymerase, N-terminal/AAA domain
MSLAAARAHAARGWHVFATKGKHPLAGSRGYLDATLDDAKIRALFEHSDYNVAIACGASGLVVMDEDVPLAFTKYAETVGETVPTTRVVRTPSGGRHFYFAAPPDVEIGNRAGVLPGIDVRGRGGYVVAPDSPGYSVAIDAEPAPLPGWVLDLLIRGKPTGETERDPLAPSFELPEVIRKGERDTVLRKFACSLQGTGVPLHVAKMAMSEAWRRCEQPAGHPFTLAEAIEKAVRAYDTYDAPGQSGTEEQQGEDLYADVAALLDGTMPDPPAPTVLHRQDGHALFYAGQVNWIFGDPDSGKTWIALAACAEALKGGQRVLVVDLDHNGLAATVTRLLDLGAPYDALRDREQFRYVEPEDAAHLLRVVADARTWRPGVAVVDSVGELLPLLKLSSNAPDDFTSAHAQVLKPLAMVGAAVLAIDHLAKAADSRQQGPTGTNAKRRAVGGASIRVIISEPFAPGRGGACFLKVHKDRHGGLRRHCPAGREPSAGIFVLEQRGDILHWHITTPRPGEGPTGQVSDADLAAIDGLDPPPVSVRDVKDRLHWGTDRASNALDQWRLKCSGNVPGTG